MPILNMIYYRSFPVNVGPPYFENRRDIASLLGIPNGSITATWKKNMSPYNFGLKHRDKGQELDQAVLVEERYPKRVYL
jgi:hypothetical protein